LREGFAFPFFLACQTRIPLKAHFRLPDPFAPGEPEKGWRAY
jgi:hypothetical protein